MNEWKPLKLTGNIKIFKYKNIKIAYKYYNKKINQKTILFLYGFGANILMADQFAPILSNFGYTVLTIDYPGHGYSPEINNISLELITELIINLLKHLKEERIILAGYSFGGIIALYFYKKYFNKIDHFILIHSSYNFKKSIFKKIIFNIFKIILTKYYFFTIKYIAIPILRDFYFTKKQIKDARYTAMKNDKKSVIKMYNIVINKNMTDALYMIKCPTLIIGSYIDILIPVSTSKKINKIVKNSKLKIFKLYGHYSIMSKPEKVAIIINKFIKN